MRISGAAFLTNIIGEIFAANPGRKFSNIKRRALKLGEEFGETAQAIIAITSSDNHKGKTWDDVREELADVIIVAVDIALTSLPDMAISEIPPSNGVDDLLRNINIQNGIIRFYEPLVEIYSKSVMIERSLWLGGQYGKVVEAIFRATPDALSNNVLPAKIHAHIGNELRGVIFMAITIALTPMPDQVELTDEQRIDVLNANIKRKLIRWAEKRAKSSDNSDVT